MLMMMVHRDRLKYINKKNENWSEIQQLKAKNYCEEREKRKRKRRRRRRRRGGRRREEEEKKKKRKKKGPLDKISFQRDLMKIVYHKTTEDLFEFLEKIEETRNLHFCILQN